jgi:formyltetrahydrofolate synthetase
LSLLSIVSSMFNVHICFFVVIDLKHRSDTQAEIDLVKRIAIEHGAFDAVMANHWATGKENWKISIR